MKPINRWPVFQQVRNYRLLKAVPETAPLAGPMLRAYFKWLLVTLIIIPPFIPFAILFWLIDKLHDLSWWLERKIKVPFNDELHAKYQKLYRAGWEAYAPYRK